MSSEKYIPPYKVSEEAVNLIAGDAKSPGGGLICWKRERSAISICRSWSRRICSWSMPFSTMMCRRSSGYARRWQRWARRASVGPFGTGEN